MYRQMKRKFFPLTLLLAGVFMLASCLSDDTNESSITLYGDAELTSFSIGTLNRYYLYNNGDTIKTVAEKTDSTTTVDCSKYKMSIDQLLFVKDEQGNATRMHPVENVDSLPAGTDVRSVVCTASTKNSGILTLKRLKKKDTDKDTLDYYNGDSVDFTKPREFRVYSTDGSYSRSYQVKLNVHKQLPDSFVWHKQSIENIVSAMGGTIHGARLTELNINGEPTIVLALSDGYATYLCTKSIEDDAKPWRVLSSNPNMVFDGNAYKNVVSFGGYVYLLNGKTLFRAADGENWEHVIPTGFDGAKQLAGATAGKIYAIADGGLIASADGVNWHAEQLDSEASLLPAEDINICTMPNRTNQEVERVIMVGNGNGSDATIWGKIEDPTDDSYKWTLYEGDDKYKLQNIDGLSVMRYDGKLYAIGGSGQNGSSAAPYAKLYCSIDQGLTWLESKLFTLPAGLPKDANADCIYMTADSQNHVWIVSATTGEVWKMRINRLGWKKEQKAFGK